MQELYTAAMAEGEIEEFTEAYWEMVDAIDSENEETMTKIFDLEDQLFDMQAALDMINIAKEEEARKKIEAEEIAEAARQKLKREQEEAAAAEALRLATEKAAAEKAER